MTSNSNIKSRTVAFIPLTVVWPEFAMHSWPEWFSHALEEGVGLGNLGLGLRLGSRFWRCVGCFFEIDLYRLSATETVHSNLSKTDLTRRSRQLHRTFSAVECPTWPSDTVSRSETPCDTLNCISSCTIRRKQRIIRARCAVKPNLISPDPPTRSSVQGDAKLSPLFCHRPNRLFGLRDAERKATANAPTEMWIVVIRLLFCIF